jgi:hypothetical protein
VAVELQLTEAPVLTADRMVTDLVMKLAKHLQFTLEEINAEAESVQEGSAHGNHLA